MPFAQARSRGVRPGGARTAASVLLALAGLLASCQERRRADVTETVPVSGTAVHYFSTAIIHSQDSVPDGMIQRSTDIVKLSGDLSGYVLYHPTSRFDFAAGTLVNTGKQVFSGTIAGSGPLLLYDDEYRIQVEFARDFVTGDVRLRESRDAPNEDGWTACRLTITGTGPTAEGEATAQYEGECTRRSS